MAYNSLSFAPYSASQVYSQFDIAGGTGNADPQFYYSTSPNNVGNFPYAVYVYTVTGYTRYQDQVTLTYIASGVGPAFACGSLITSIVGADGTANYAGMVLKGGVSNGTGTLTYLNYGLDVAFNSSNGTITTVLSPAWTTGFMSVPSYSTNGEVQQGVIEAQFEEGYSQRSATSINPNTDIWNLAFLDRSSKETRYIRHYTQMAAGVYSFPITITDPNFSNVPNQKFITAQGAKWNTKSYNVNDVTVMVRRVFDI